MSEVTRDSEIAAEQRHVDRVYARVEALRVQAQRLQREGYRLAGARTPGSLVERDALVHYAAVRLRALDAEYEGLVFGRLDLLTASAPHRTVGAARRGPPAARDRLAGARRGAVLPGHGRGPAGRRAPAGDPLHRAPGASTWRTTCSTPRPTGGVAVVGDGALLATPRPGQVGPHARHRRDDPARAGRGDPGTGRRRALIEGGPGTGKTAVALHRAAHLLYRDRSRYEGAGVLLVGPSPVFMSYVERVLPSLGEDTAELRSLGHVVDGISADRLDPPALASLKGSLRMRRCCSG